MLCYIWLLAAVVKIYYFWTEFITLMPSEALFFLGFKLLTFSMEIAVRYSQENHLLQTLSIHTSSLVTRDHKTNTSNWTLNRELSFHELNNGGKYTLTVNNWKMLIKPSLEGNKSQINESGSYNLEQKFSYNSLPHPHKLTLLHVCCLTVHGQNTN